MHFGCDITCHTDIAIVRDSEFLVKQSASALSGFKLRVGTAIDRSVVAINQSLNPNF